MHSKHRSRMSYVGPVVVAFLRMLGSILIRAEEKEFLSNEKRRQGGFKMHSRHRSRMFYVVSVALAFFGALGLVLGASGLIPELFVRFRSVFVVTGTIGVTAVWWQFLRERCQLLWVEGVRKNDRVARTFRYFSKLGIVFSRNKTEDRKGPAAQMHAGQGGL